MSSEERCYTKVSTTKTYSGYIVGVEAMNNANKVLFAENNIKGGSIFSGGALPLCPIAQAATGYVVHKLLRKTWRSSTYKSETSQSVICLLNNLIENDNRSQRLIKTTNRGGLTSAKVEIQQIFVLAEEAFRKTLVKSSHTAKLDVQLIIDLLMMDTQVISMYNTLVDDDENYSIKADVKFSVLENMLTLYVRVRAFSFAKAIVNNHKVAMKKVKLEPQKGNR